MANAPIYKDSAGNNREADVAVLLDPDTLDFYKAGGAGGGGGAATIADGADVTQGAKADAKSTATDTTAITAMSVWKQISFSVQAFVTAIGAVGDAAWSSGSGSVVALLKGIAARFPAALGGTTAANSWPVVLSSDGPFATQTGSITETAPATDTASSGLNGRLQRIAQRLTSMIALMPVGAATSTLTNVASQATNITVLASNAARLGCIIHNDDANPVLLKLGTGASATSYSFPVPSGGTYVMPRGELYTGIIDGIWTADGSGSARVTELTA